MESQMGILETAEKMLAGNHGALTTVANEARFALGLVARRPFQCLVQVTNRCNMKCSFCDFWPNGVPRSQELTVADYQRIADQMAELGSFLVSIEGGEPLVRPDIVDIVKVFAKRHLPVLYTNGWFVDRQFAHNVFAAGITQVGVSIDFPDATRHDTKRGLLGAHQRAWSAVEHFRSAAPHGGKAVHVMTVVMRDNQNDMEALLRQSRDAGVGHAVTLLAAGGYRRGTSEAEPTQGACAHLAELWKSYPHFRSFRDYLDGFEPFLAGTTKPRCHAGKQGFNLDHIGNVATCIEKIDKSVGNVRHDDIAVLLKRLREQDLSAGCQDCWTFCRGFSQSLGGGGTVRSLTDLATRMRA
jgi:MoaA/NifB/PqqE/SkfB family radical SAM enzyme